MARTELRTGRGKETTYTTLLYSDIQKQLFSLSAIQRLLGGPFGLAKATPGSPALLGVPSRLGTLLCPSCTRKNDAPNS